jgi:hypothetical protein
MESATKALITALALPAAPAAHDGACRPLRTLYWRSAIRRVSPRFWARKEVATGPNPLFVSHSARRRLVAFYRQAEPRDRRSTIVDRGVPCAILSLQRVAASDAAPAPSGRGRQPEVLSLGKRVANPPIRGAVVLCALPPLQDSERDRLACLQIYWHRMCSHDGSGPADG